jgi:hypothetical protein
MERLRKVKLEALTGRPFILETWETDRPDPRTHRFYIGYRLTGPQGVVFEGSDFSPSPMDAIDSDAALRGILGFLTLRPGDTDPEYFEDYTPAQLAFCETDAEALSRYDTEDMDEAEEMPFEDIDT